MAKMNAGLAVFLIVIAVAGTYIATTRFGFTPLSFTGGGGGAGAWCQSAGSIIPLSQSTTNTGGIQPGCYNLPMTLAINIVDQFSGANLASWGCLILSPTGQQLESLTSSSGGVCTSANSYSTGTKLYVKLCESGTTCTYSNANTVIYYPLPAQNGANGQGAGVVPFGSTSSQTSITLQQRVVQVDNVFKLSVKNINGTLVCSITCTSFTEKKAQTGVGSKPQYIWTLTNTKTGTAPYGVGYASSQEVDINFRLLQAVFVQEVKASTGTDMIAMTSTPERQFFVKSATDIVFGIEVPDNSLLKQVASDSTIVATGQYDIPISYDITALTSTDNVQLITNLYLYFVVTYFTSTGVTNTEAVTTFSTVTGNFAP